MKKQHALTAALAAIAGLSFATLYAAPSYTPNPNSPINTTPALDSASQALDSFDDYIGVIDAKLTVATESLVIPAGSGFTIPAFNNFNAAVTAAVGDATTPAEVQAIVAAATQYQFGNYAGKVKDILKSIASAHPLKAEDAVIGAIAGNSAKAADAAAGAIGGLIESPNQIAVATLDFGDVADEAVDHTTKILIEKIAKAAVSATKKGPSTSPTNAEKVAIALVDALIADDSKRFYLDDVARGITAGGKGIDGTTQGGVAAAGLSRLNGANETARNIAEFVSGALKVVVVSGTSPSTAYSEVLGALQAEPLVGATALSTIDAVSAAHLALRNAGGGTEAAALSAALTSTYANHLEAFMIGAAQNKSGKAPDLVQALLADGDIGTVDDTEKRAVVGAAVRAKFSGAGKVTAAAITATTNSVAPSLAVDAAIKNTTWEYAGVVAGSAIKTLTNPSLPTVNADTQPDDLASAAVTSAVQAGYAGAINDIALQAVKARKDDDALIVQAMVANGDSAGWREAIVAQAVISNKTNKADIAAKALLGADAAPVTSDFEKASLALTAELAEDAKNNNKTTFDDAAGDFFGDTEGALIDVNGSPTNASEFAKAIMFARGGVNIKNAGPILALAIKFNTGPANEGELLSIARSIYKKNSSVIDLQYTVIKDALANNGDNVFDLVDHQVFTHVSKLAPEIVSAAVAARPEYAHYIARAGAFRAPAAAAKVATAAITFAHMTVNRNTAGAQISNPDDPAAVAAISSATILGILDAKLSDAKRDAAVKGAAAALVKAASTLESGSATFRQSNGLSTSSFDTVKSTGVAGAVTGMIAQLQGNLAAGSASTTTLTPLAQIALFNAAKAAKKLGLQIAQAAAQAAQFIYTENGGSGDISNVFIAQIVAQIVSAGAGTAGALEMAVRFGIAETQASRYGAGAKGILDYAHRSGTGTPVTSLENF